MKLKTILYVLCISLFLVTTMAFTFNKPDNPITNSELLSRLRMIILQGYTNPIKIDDDFSKKVWSNYIKSLDPKKQFFLDADINLLRQYENSIDEEINGGDITFYSTALEIYAKRLNAAEEGYKAALKTPFKFNKDHFILLEEDSLSFAKKQNELKQRWNDDLQFRVIDNLLSLQNQRDSAAKETEFYGKTDIQLEAIARGNVQKQMDRLYKRLKSDSEPEKQFNQFINAVTTVLDPHSNYLPPLEKRAFDEGMSRRFYGIGAQLQEEDGIIKVMGLEPGGPALKSGLIDPNDLILKVGQGRDGSLEDIGGMPISDAVKLIRGDKNTEVSLLMKKIDGTEKLVVLMRNEIVQDEAMARSAIINQDGKKLGYISLPGFYADTKDRNGAHSSRDVANELVKLKNENIEGVILDLRNNGGGSLDEVVKMLGLFIKEGPVVQIKRTNQPAEILYDPDKSQLYDGPLVVMVNLLSASASEIFAAAVQDYKRGIVIGSSSTYGKGTVQMPIPINMGPRTANTPQGALKLTIKQFYRVNGGSTQQMGVISDLILPDLYDHLKIQEKDKPFALKWNQIDPVNFSYPMASFNENEINRNFQNRMAKDTVFSKISKNIEWISNHSIKKYNLNIVNYKSLKDSLRIKVDELKDVQKLKKELQVNQLLSDATAAKDMDQAKANRYKDWIKNLRTDIYINEASAVATDLIKSKPAYTAN